MKTIARWVSTTALLVLAGCSGNHRAATSVSAASTSASQAVTTTSGAPAVEVTPVALPAYVAQPLFAEPWRPEPVDDHLGGAILLKRPSLDGNFDLVILEKGAQSFVAFARHGRWDAVSGQPAHGKLMYLRLKFEDGTEQRVEWDELAAGSADLHAILWSYPADPTVALGPSVDTSKGGNVGGDQLLLQEMMRHRGLVLEVEPGLTTQFDLTGLGREMTRIRPLQPEPILSASQTGQ